MKWIVQAVCVAVVLGFGVLCSKLDLKKKENAVLMGFAFVLMIICFIALTVWLG